jgi:hypothetical protein
MDQHQPVHLRVVGVTGSRKGIPSKAQLRAFYRLTQLRPSPTPIRLGMAARRHQGPPTHLIHGGAPGIDRAVANWARRWTDWAISVIPAAWNTYGGFAGPLRNSLIVRSADFLVSFGGGTGTANCVRQALEHGTPVVDLSRLAQPESSPGLAWGSSEAPTRLSPRTSSGGPNLPLHGVMAPIF